MSTWRIFWERLQTNDLQSFQRKSDWGHNIYSCVKETCVRPDGLAFCSYVNGPWKAWSQVIGLAWGVLPRRLSTRHRSQSHFFWLIRRSSSTLSSPCVTENLTLSPRERLSTLEGTNVKFQRWPYCLVNLELCLSNRLLLHNSLIQQSHDCGQYICQSHLSSDPHLWTGPRNNWTPTLEA